jgi:predicted nuclease with RNAse H fold
LYVAKASAFAAVVVIDAGVAVTYPLGECAAWATETRIFPHVLGFEERGIAVIETWPRN